MSIHPSISLPQIDDDAVELKDLHPSYGQEQTDATKGITPPDEGETLEAVYEFIAENSWELSVGGGDRVKLLRSHDSSGSKDWWLVRDEAGHEGYVDPSYLNQLCMDDDDYVLPYTWEADSDR